MMARLLILGALLLACVAGAQEKSKLVFDAPAKRVVWIGTEYLGPPSESAIKAEGPELELDASTARSKAFVYVWNQDSGNLAAKRAQETVGTWNVTADSDFWIAEVIVRVESGGKPVESASVTIKDKVRDQSLVLDSTLKGEAKFWGILPGSVKVTVEYGVEGKPADPVIRSFDLKLKRTKAVPVLVVSLADNVKTVDTSASGAQDGQTTGDSKAAGATGGGKDGTVLRDTTNPIGQIIGFLIAVAVAAALAWFALRWMKQNQATVQARLEKMGVEIPNPEAAAQAAQAPAPIAPEPIQKIVLDDADPLVPPSPSISAIPIANATGIPTLTSDSGLQFTIAEGDNSVSRESGAIVVLGESTISRNHAVVRRQGAQVSVADLGSTNGTFVNGTKIAQETALKHGDWVQFGAIRFRYEG